MNKKPNAVRSKPKYDGNCHNCGIKGHKRDDCWKLKENASAACESEFVFSAIEQETNSDYQGDRSCSKVVMRNLQPDLVKI